jgi:3-phosphoshikimate 1-carboxyvinyltransferase
MTGSTSAGGGAPRVDPYEVRPVAGAVRGAFRPPGSKSITNRALVAAALAEGTSTIHNALDADDTSAMIVCLRALGIEIDRGEDGVIEASGCGGALPNASASLDARLSGTTARFLLPLLALGPGPYVLDGRAPLRARPMGDGIDALRSLGAQVDERAGSGHLPVAVAGGPVVGGAVVVRGAASSQFTSGLLLSGPAMAGGLDVTVDGELVSPSFVTLTERVMSAFGVDVSRADRHRLVVPGGGYRGSELVVEPDAAAASYLMAAGVITGGAVTVPGLGRSSAQSDLGFADALEAMGADVEWSADAVTVRAAGPISGVTVDMGDCSDTAQTLAAVAVFADGPTEVTGIGFIRGKETDRIAAIVTELTRCGITAHETDDGFVVHPGRPRPAVVQTYDDHRMAMSFALLGLRAEGIRIAEPACVGKTWPDYFGVLEAMTATARRAERG